MKMLNKIYDFIHPKNWSIIKVYRDFENFRDWKTTIKREQLNPKSKFNKWKLQRTKLYDIYLIVTLDESDAQLKEDVKRMMVLESLTPLNLYLDEELGFAECLTCEFNQFEDPNGNLTLSYLIVYRFLFNKFSLKWLIKFFVTIGLIAFIIIRIDLVKQFIIWVSSVI